MKLSADLSLRQTLLMTSDMRLAISILSMTAHEIDELINEELEKNPFLDELDGQHGVLGLYQSGERVSAFDVALDTSVRSVDFRQFLLEQVGEMNFNVVERDIAIAIINSLDDDGILSESDEIYRLIIAETNIFVEWIESVRRRIMDLEPVGCAALTSYESLLHQAKRKCNFAHEEFLSLLSQASLHSRGRWPISRLAKLKEDSDVNELRNLYPRPSHAYREVIHHEVIDPDIVVNKRRDDFVVSMTRRMSERVVYRPSLDDKGRKKDQSAFIFESRKRAKFMMRAIRFRESSLLAVSEAIVFHQQAWLRNEAPLHPLSLHDVAEKCGLHESSVSRLVRGKYLSCDKGVFELKYFFSQAVIQHGQDHGPSSTAIKDQIRTIVAKESKVAPLSDQKIVEKLKEQGIVISRRTVNKYRDMLNLRSAHERRCL